MSSYKQTAWPPAGHRDPTTETLREALAAALRNASALFAQLAYRLARPPAHTNRATPQLEFYAEAGAPEGALYVDGTLVGYVPGVRRL